MISKDAPMLDHFATCQHSYGRDMPGELQHGVWMSLVPGCTNSWIFMDIYGMYTFIIFCFYFLFIIIYYSLRMFKIFDWLALYL